MDGTVLAVEDAVMGSVVGVVIELVDEAPSAVAATPTRRLLAPHAPKSITRAPMSMIPPERIRAGWASRDRFTSHQSPSKQECLVGEDHSVLMLLGMSSGGWAWEVGVELSGDVALEAAHGFSFGEPFFHPTLDVLAGAGVVDSAGHHDPP